MWSSVVLQSEIIKSPAQNHFRGKETARDQTAHDRHAQAALIEVMLQKLNWTEESYLQLRYFAPMLRSRQARIRFAQSRSAGGNLEVRREEEWDRYFMEVTRYLVVKLGGSTQNYRALRKMILNQVGESVGIDSIRKDLHCNKTDALAKRRQVNDYLSDLHLIGIGHMDELLREAGLVGEE